MKKLSVLLVAMAVAVSASAGIQFKSTHNLQRNKIVKTEKVNINDIKAQMSATKFGVITDQPAGELKTYNREGYAVTVDGNGYLNAGSQAGNRMDIVYAEDNVVYMKNIICGCGGYFGDSWVQGTLSEDGSTITVPMGQSIYWSDYYQADVVLCMGETYLTEDNKIGFEIDDRVTEVVYEIDGQTIKLVGTEGPEEGVDGYEAEDYLAYGLSAYWADDNSWSGFIEWSTVLTEREPVVTPNIITEVPEGCELYTFYRNTCYIANSIFGIYNGNTDGKINVAIDAENGKAYIQNPAWWHDSYNSWVEGTYDAQTGMISVPTGQYLSWNETYEYGIQLGWGYTTVEEAGIDEETGEMTYTLSYAIDERTTEINFMLDGNYFYLLGCDGDINAEFPYNYVATGMLTYWSDDLSMTALEWSNDGEPMGEIVNLVPAIPANPSADEWYDCGSEGGFSKFYFTLPTTDVDGNMLDPEHISYSIFVDNGNGAELFVFPAEDYDFDWDLTGGVDITEVTYDIYSNAVDFRDYFVYMYRTNAEGFEPLFTENIGIQVYYTVNGEKNASDIVWLYPVDPSSANEVNATKTVASVRYFNVAGQEMAQPQGMTIKVTTYTDGTTNVSKLVK